VFIELSEALDCPRCREGYGLVTFVTRSDRRRVLAGHLGCPLCEAEFPVVEGALGFGAPPRRPANGRGAPPADPAAALRAAALLGVGEGPGRVVLLGPDLAPLALEVARMAERIEILAWVGESAGNPAWDISELARGVNPLLGAEPGRWPVRGGALDGVALSGSSAAFLDESARALRPGGRLVLLDPDGEARQRLDGLGIDEVASDATTWVGRRR